MEYQEPEDRIRRRHRLEQSHRIVQSRRSDHRRRWGCDWLGECRWCRTGAFHWFDKNHNNCHCQRRRTGRPRIAGGMCRVGSRDRIYHWRNLARELNRVIVRRHVPPDMDQVALLTPKASEVPNWN